jgi:ELWxxDGT repeat protein
VFNNELFFTATNGTQRALWRFDGMQAVLATQIGPANSSYNPTGLTVVGNSLYFSADDGHPIPEFMGEEWLYPVGVIRRVRHLQAIGWVWIPPLVDECFQGLVQEIPSWFPDVACGHDRPDLRGGLCHC